MKKITAFYLALLLFSLCGCEENNKNSQTRFLLDTVVTLTADCNDEILSGAFELCENYEKMLSRTIKESDVQKLNSSEGFITVSEETAEIIEKALYYSELSNGKFDITVYSVSSLWDFNNQIVPDRSEIAEALQNIDYQSIEIEENCVNLNGRQIDLGGIAKGYIADRLKDYFTGNGTDSGIINLGGNIVVFGNDYKIGIQKPFSNDISATLHLKNCSAVTSGIYQRYIKSGDKIYHHIIDPDTGYGVENELAGVTIIGESSFDCDALSTVCMLLGTENGKKLIENTDGFEAVFIDRKGKITITDGLFKKDKDIYLK